MLTPLATKLHAPSSSAGLVHRPHLVARIDARPEGKLTLISAPAGSGKTTLLGQWIASRQHPVAWLSLDEGDNDPARFLAYLVAALQTVQEGLGEPVLAALRNPQPPSAEQLLTGLINELATLPDRIVLVLDDYHLITAPAIHEALTFLLDHLPPALHLILASRTDPPWPLARLRAQGQMTELRAADLRFTPEETATFLNDVMGLGLSPADVAALEARTEGWIAGLQMAALSMRGRADRSAFVATFTGSHRYVLDYLTEEVLERQSEAVQSFLLATSLLRRLSGPLCDAVTGRTDGQALLEWLDEANLFLVPLDEERRWYRYHHLFADLLQRRLHQAHPEQVSELHRRAFTWHRAHHLYRDALHHALAAQDVAGAAELIQAVGRQIMAQGEPATVRDWIAALPGDAVGRRPDLCVLHAWTLTLTNRWHEVEPRLQAAERALAAQSGFPEAEDLWGQIAAIRAYEARRRNDVSGSIRLLQEARRRLDRENRMVRTAVSQSLGQAHLFAGDLPRAMAAFQEAASLGQASGNELAGLVAWGQQVAIHIAQGQLHQAVQCGHQAIREHPDPSPALCHPYVFLGQVLYEWDDPDAAADYLAQSLLWSERIGYGPTSPPVRLMAALTEWVQQVQRARGEPTALPAPVEAILRRVPEEPDAVDLGGWRVRLWLEQGNLPAALRWAEACQAGECPPGAWPAYRDLALARVWMAQGDLARAFDLLRRVQKAAQAAGGRGWQIQALVLEAVIQRRTGQPGRALAALAQALVLAEPQGYVRTFVDEGEVLRSLLQELKSQQPNRTNPRALQPYMARLLAAFPDPGQMPAAHTIEALVEPLSARELEVLGFMAAGLSNQEIADTLVLALGTVKKHTHNIYGKLGVANRTQAILRAAELNLLPPRQRPL